MAIRMRTASSVPGVFVILFVVVSYLTPTSSVPVGQSSQANRPCSTVR